MEKRLVLAGFGGQGVMAVGQMLTYAGMVEGKEVSWLPSYGPEMRGGTANCSVIISDTPIGSPVVEDIDILFAFNAPSLHKFIDDVVPGGVVIVNSSLIEGKIERDDIGVCYIDATGIAMEAGSAKASNMVMLGAYLGAAGNMSMEAVYDAFLNIFGEAKIKLWPTNEAAIKAGKAAAEADLKK
ncbi:MAG: 2-oxoacid:ferredoxin oxidoreductase subunit gamma [Tissierellia bacterium]|nr:2-oxoacid:ferredoxin oxidoreductase subunit gamma [Tissierellia bacterium]